MQLHYHNAEQTSSGTILLTLSVRLGSDKYTFDVIGLIRLEVIELLIVKICTVRMLAYMQNLI